MTIRRRYFFPKSLSQNSKTPSPADRRGGFGIGSRWLMWLLLMASSQWAVPALAVAESRVLRIALIDVSQTDDLPKTLMDLLFVEMSSEEALELVEREEIQKVLQEQKLSLAFGRSIVSARSVQVGKLVSAEAIVMLAAEPKENGLQPVRVRIVDTKLGIRYWESRVQWPQKASEIAAWSQALATQIKLELARLRNATGTLQLVSVSEFINQEISSQTNWLGAILRASLQQRLLNQPNIVFMERDEILPLIQERALTSDLPQALRESTITIDAQYQLHIGQAATEVEVTLHVRRAHQALVTKSVRGFLRDKNVLCQTVAEAVLHILGRSSSEPIDGFAEAKLLADIGQRYLTLDQKQDALRPLLAAYALDPDSFRIQALLLHAGRELANNSIWRSRRLKGEQREKLKRQTVPLLMLMADVAHKLLGHKEFPLSSSAPWDPFYHRSQVIFAYQSLFTAPALMHRYLGEEDVESLRSLKVLQEVIGRLYEKHLEMTQTEKDRQYYFALSAGIGGSIWWEKSPSEALAKRVELLELADDLLRDSLVRNKYRHDANLIFSGAYFDLNRIPTWSERYNLEPLYEEHLQQLSQSNRLFLRLRAEWAWATYYARHLKDKGNSIKHYQRFVDLLVSEILADPKLAHLCESHWVSIVNPGIPLSKEQTAESYSKVIRASFDHVLLRNPQLWENLILNAYHSFEEAGSPEKADQLLQDCIACLNNSSDKSTYSQASRISAKLTGWRETLQARHPKHLARADEMIRVQVEARSLFNAKSIQKSLGTQGDRVSSLEFHYLISTPEAWLLVCTNAEGNQPIVVWLDTESFRVKSAMAFPEQIPRDPTKSMNIRRYVRRSPFVAVAGQDVVVGLHGGGIVWFRPRKEPIHFSIKHLKNPTTLKQPLANDSIRQIVLLDRVAYVRIGEKIGDKALMELELDSGKSRVLFSSREEFTQHPLAGAKVSSIASDSDNSLLLVLARSQNFPSGLVKFWPKSGKYQRIHANKKNIPQTYFSFSHYVHYNGYFVGTARRTGHRSQEWFLYLPQNSSPQKLIGEHLPAGDDVRNLTLTEEGKLLAVTRRQVLEIDPFPKSTIKSDEEIRPAVRNES